MPMKTLSIFAASLTFISSAHAAPLTVNVDGVEARGGDFYISVQAEGEFMREEATAAEIVTDIGAGTYSASFDVPAGAYAISIWHDENGDGVFDRAANGMPLDGWAMSGGRLMGPPTFEDVSVDVPSEGAAVSVSMTYNR
ncbi:MAG: DUF2141 domain-containing protein [Pseudomonadota bacterium]